MQECIASWAHLFANFSWWGCLMIVVAGVQSDVYHHKVKVVSPRKICKAPSNRAKCTKCKANIEAGELRIELLHYWSLPGARVGKHDRYNLTNYGPTVIHSSAT